MKNTKLTALLLLLFTCTASFAQQCNCALAFKWMKKAFEENDAGYQYIIDQKGYDAYQSHNRKFEGIVNQLTNPDSCIFAIKDWSKFFRVGHFRFVINNIAAEGSPYPAGNKMRTM